MRKTARHHPRRPKTRSRSSSTPPKKTTFCLPCQLDTANRSPKPQKRASSTPRPRLFFAPPAPLNTPTAPVFCLPRRLDTTNRAPKPCKLASSTPRPRPKTLSRLRLDPPRKTKNALHTASRAKICTVCITPAPGQTPHGTLPILRVRHSSHTTNHTIRLPEQSPPCYLPEHIPITPHHGGNPT